MARLARDALSAPVSVVHHPGHEVDDTRPLLAHLEARHGYTAGLLEGAHGVFLQAVHARAHARMNGDDEGTVPELTGSAERLFGGALETTERLAHLDATLARDLAARWIEALSALVGGPER